jgi:predicted  nucleic acid-binding Zn ribbon protein
MAELKFPTLEEFGRQAGEWALDEFEYKGHTIREWADKITTGEYQPVKHGRWLSHVEYCKLHNCLPSGTSVYFWCSRCESAAKEKTLCCPNCGATMDGGADE